MSAIKSEKLPVVNVTSKGRGRPPAIPRPLRRPFCAMDEPPKTASSSLNTSLDTTVKEDDTSCSAIINDTLLKILEEKDGKDVLIEEVKKNVHDECEKALETLEVARRRITLDFDTAEKEIQNYYQTLSVHLLKAKERTEKSLKQKFQEEFDALEQLKVELTSSLKSIDQMNDYRQLRRLRCMLSPQVKADLLLKDDGSLSSILERNNPQVYVLDIRKQDSEWHLFSRSSCFPQFRLSTSPNLFDVNASLEASTSRLINMSTMDMTMNTTLNSTVVEADSSSDYQIKPSTLKINYSVEVSVSHVESVSKFYVVLKSLESNLLGYANFLWDIRTKLCRLESPTRDDYCVVRLESRRFAKGKILLQLGEEVFKIFLLDSGETKDIDASDIFHLPTPKDGVIKTHAIECTLHGVEPTDQEWSQDATEVFNNFAADGRMCVVPVKTLGESEVAGKVYQVNLRKRMDIKSVCVDLYCSLASVLAVKGYSKTPSFLHNQEMLYKGSTNFIERRSEEFKLGSIHVGKICPGSTPSEFKFSCPSVGDYGVSQSQLESKLEQTYVSDQFEMELPKIKQPCAVKIADKFHRALILDIAPGSDGASVKLELVDSGEIAENVPADNLFQLPCQFATIPKMAMTLKLSGICPTLDNWSSECIEYFHSLVGKNIKISVDQVMTTDNVSHSVTAYVVLKDRDLCINADLVHQSYAGFLDGAGPYYREVEYLYGKKSESGDSDSPYVSSKQLEGSFKGQLLQFQSPNCFYFLHEVDESELEKLDALKERMDRYYMVDAIEELDEEKEDCPFEPKDMEVGNMAAAFRPIQSRQMRMYGKGHWLRCRILEKISDDSFDVLLVDFGEIISVHKDSLRGLPSNFLELELPIYKYQLDEIGSFKESNSNPSDELVKTMKLKECFDFYVKPKHTSPNSMANVMDRVLTNYSCEAFLIGTQKQPHSLFEDDQKMVNLASGLLRFGIAVPAIGNTKDSNRTLDSDNWLPPEPLEDTRARGKLFCVDPNGIFHFVPSQKEEELVKVNRLLNEYFKDSVPKAHDNYWFAGQICAAQYDIDDLWYRGRVIVADPTTQVATVLLIDYGNDVTLSYSHLRKDVSLLKKCPQLSYPLAVEDVVYLGQRGEATDLLHKQLVDKVVEVELLNKPENDDGVFSYAKISSNQVNVVQLLVAVGLAKFYYQ